MRRVVDWNQRIPGAGAVRTVVAVADAGSTAAGGEAASVAEEAVAVAPTPTML